ncbi:MAG: hypothetical protein ABF709_03605 [Leuconostoc pseudomesenteroides]|uniref:hypothetical protein n=1 Tax=Leuconostoc pseudomesenteroides TaxID=33968 RepID=UPI0039E8F20B
MGKTKIFTVLGKLTAGALIPEALNQGAKILIENWKKDKIMLKFQMLLGCQLKKPQWF